MTGLDNLVNKIISDGSNEAEMVIKKAKEEKNKKIEKAYSDSEKLLANNKKQSEEEAIRLQERYITEQNIKLRDNLLDKKQKILNDIFAKAEEELKQLPLSNYEVFIKTYLVKMDLTGQETVYIPKKYQELNIESVVEHVKANSGKAEFEFVFQEDVESGFIVKKYGIENNNTFKALLDFYREDLEIELIKIFE